MEVLDWDRIVGHGEKTARLRALINEDKMPHALLIAGPEGVGKFLVAQMTAAAIFCNGEPTRPCGSCSSCQAMAANRHPDLVVVEPDGQNIKIEQIRNLQTEISLVPYLGSYRVAILRQAEKLTLPAANSLLKVIEEPPANIIFILLTSNWQAMLATILSRCRRLDLQPLSTAEMLPILAERNLSPDNAEIIARLSEGSVGRAFSLIDNNEIEMRNSAFDLLHRFVDCKTMNMVWQQSQAIGEFEREKVQILLLYCKLLLRDLIIMHDDQESELLYNIDLRQRLIPLLQLWSKQSLFAAVNEVTYLQKTLKANVNQRLAIERFLIKLRDL